MTENHILMSRVSHALQDCAWTLAVSGLFLISFAFLFAVYDPATVIEHGSGSIHVSISGWEEFLIYLGGMVFISAPAALVMSRVLAPKEDGPEDLTATGRPGNSSPISATLKSVRTALYQDVLCLQRNDNGFGIQIIPQKDDGGFSIFFMGSEGTPAAVHLSQNGEVIGTWEGVRMPCPDETGGK